MFTVKVYNQAGEQVGTRDVDPAAVLGISADAEPNVRLLKQAVVMYMNNQRQGTRKGKTRAEVDGSSRKLYKQKGTGRARAGNVRTPVRRGGGRAFPKLPRDFRQDLPTKARRTATMHALFSKLKDGQLVLVEPFTLDTPSTRTISTLLGRIGCAGGVTIAPAQANTLLWKSGRNIPRTQVVPVHALNAYSILQSRHLLLTTDAFDALRASPAAEPAEVGRV